MIPREKLRQVRDDMQKALDPVARAHGLSITVKGANVGSASATFWVEVAETARAGEAPPLDREAEVYRALAKTYGLPPATLGMSLLSRGRLYTIRGLNVNAPRFPVLADRDDGRGFRFPAETVADLLRQQHPEKWAELMREK